MADVDRPTLWHRGRNAPSLILDTNVFLDIYSCADLADEYMRPTTAVDSPNGVYRRARARESLLLAIHLHRSKMKTWSLPIESLSQLLRRADPKKLDDPKMHFTLIFVNYTKDRALADWTPRVSSQGDEGLAGEACDDYLVQVAKLNHVPLVTNEGYSPRGIDDAHGLRRKARDAGVGVFTPREYWLGKINPKRAARRFIHDFREGVPRYLRQNASNATALAEAFSWIDGYFHHILYGIAADGRSRLRIDL